MNGIIFSGPAQVEFQGERVLRFESIKQDHAEYLVLGFRKPPVTVRDYRKVGLDAINTVLGSGEVYGFAARFNVPAHVTILHQGQSDIELELRDTTDPDPPHMLWAAIGLNDELPVYDYVFDRLEPLDGKAFAFLSLYERPQKRRTSSSF